MLVKLVENVITVICFVAKTFLNPIVLQTVFVRNNFSLTRRRFYGLASLAINAHDAFLIRNDERPSHHEIFKTATELKPERE